MPQLKDLLPGQKFTFTNGSLRPSVFVGITKTPTGRNSYNYLFPAIHGKACKGKGQASVELLT